MALIDSHVHLFPPGLFDAIWKWFDHKAWPIVHKLQAEQVIGKLQDKGVNRAVGLCYSHRPGLAEELNGFMAGLATRYPMLVPLGTVLPAEPDREEVLRRAFEVHGLSGIKIHCHVQQVSPDAEEMKPVCEAVRQHGGVLVIHAGRAPVLDEMKDKIHALCSVERTGRMLRAFPGLRVIVPHLGMDEYREYRDLLLSHEGLYLDTAMAVGGYFGNEPPVDELEDISERIVYGSDFPNLPYPYERELEALRSSGLSQAALLRITGENAAALFGRA